MNTVVVLSNFKETASFQDLELMPWEMLPILFKHPVSRVPSLHFAYALYDKHKDDIVNGNK